MNAANIVGNVLQVCMEDGLYDKLSEAFKSLEQINKELMKYLESKRGEFARFYFLADEGLLEILSEAKNPLKVQPHLKQSFENIKEIKFDDDKMMLGM